MVQAQELFIPRNTRPPPKKPRKGNRAGQQVGQHLPRRPSTLPSDALISAESSGCWQGAVGRVPEHGDSEECHPPSHPGTLRAATHRGRGIRAPESQQHCQMGAKSLKSLQNVLVPPLDPLKKWGKKPQTLIKQLLS